MLVTFIFVRNDNIPFCISLFLSQESAQETKDNKHLKF